MTSAKHDNILLFSITVLLLRVKIVGCQFFGFCSSYCRCCLSVTAAVVAAATSLAAAGDNFAAGTTTPSSYQKCTSFEVQTSLCMF
jgi:hypothetical protein